MIFKFSRIAGSVLLAFGAVSTGAFAGGFADDAMIYWDGAGGISTNVKNNLTTHLNNASYNVSANIGGASSDALPALTSFKQVWDVRYNNTTALTSGDQSKYLSYLQGGGTLFLMGENTGFAARNNSILSLIQLAGGGTLTIPSNSANSQTVQGAVATTPNALPTVTYLAAGGVASSGTGTCLTKDNTDKCAAVAFGGHTLANARAGSLISVLDVNFLDRTSDVDSEKFIDNLIRYLADQAVIGAQPYVSSGNFVPVSNTITNGVANTLDGLLAASVINVDMAAAIGSLSGLNDTQRAAAMTRLTPTANNSLARLGAGSMLAGLSTVSARLEGIRNAGALAYAEPSNEKMILAAAGPMSGLLETKELRHGVWGKIFGSSASQDAMDGYAGYKADTWGMTFGVDSRLAQDTVVGAAVTYAATNLNQRDFLTGSGNDLQNFQLTAYANQDFGPWYLEGLLSYGQQHYKSHRDTNVTGIASANYDGDLFAVRATAGMPYSVSERLVVTPFASLEYNRMTQEGYLESGAGPLNLQVNGTNAERVRSGLGVRLAGEMNVGSGSVRPSVHVQWLHDYLNDGVNTTASFTGGGSAFVTPGQRVARDSGNVGGSVVMAVAKNAAVSIHYDFEAGNGFTNQTGQVVGQWWF